MSTQFRVGSMRSCTSGSGLPRAIFRICVVVSAVGAFLLWWDASGIQQRMARTVVATDMGTLKMGTSRADINHYLSMRDIPFEPGPNRSPYIAAYVLPDLQYRIFNATAVPVVFRFSKTGSLQSYEIGDNAIKDMEKDPAPSPR